MIKFKNELLYSLNRFRILVIIFIFFAITALLNCSYIHMPPVWDTVAVYSPAIYLYENHFDFSGLLTQKGYMDGGPNMNSFSVVNFLTYFFIFLSKGHPEVFLPALHFVQFLFAGVVLAFTFFAASRLFGRVIGLLIAFAILFFPLFLVQTSYLNTEIMGAALFICATVAWASRFLFLSVLLAIVACMVKSFGIVLICSLAFLVLVDRSIPVRQRLIASVTLIFFMFAIETLKLVYSDTGAIIDRENTNFIHYSTLFFSNLHRAPDLELLVITALFMPFVFRFMHREDDLASVMGAFSALASGNASQRLLVSVYLIPFVFMGFVITLPLSGVLFFPLLRYYVWILPLLFIGTAYACKLGLMHIFNLYSNATHKKVDRALSTLLVILILFFSANRDGRYYPSLGADITSFSMTERSFEYLDFYKIQRDSVIALAELQSDLPAFVTRVEYYYLSSPLMGYVNKRPDNIFFIKNQPYNKSDLCDYPDEFLLLNTPTRTLHGGKVAKKILAEAMEDPGYSVSKLASFRRGPYIGSIHQISKTGREKRKQCS